jgi:hypothetical protein
MQAASERAVGFWGAPTSSIEWCAPFACATPCLSPNPVTSAAHFRPVPALSCAAAPCVPGAPDHGRLLLLPPFCCCARAFVRCEDDYTHSFYIAEWWNSWSNVPGFFIGALAIFIGEAKRRRGEGDPSGCWPPFPSCLTSPLLPRSRAAHRALTFRCVACTYAH